MASGERICRHETLARGPVAQVQRCTDCGCVAIHMGATTVRVDPAVLKSLVSTLQQALARMEQEEEISPSLWSSPPGQA